MDTAKGIVVTTDNVASVREFGYPLHESIRPVLDGYMETVYPKGLKEPYLMLVNEEGLLMKKPLNVIGSILYETHQHGHPIVGNIVLMKFGYRNGEPDIIGLTDEEANELMNQIIQLVIQKEEA